MRKLIMAGSAAAAIIAAGSLAGTAEAALATSVATTPPITQSSSPVTNVGCWCGPYRCACGYHRRYYRPYRYYRYRY
jgi:hypothetical protein